MITDTVRVDDSKLLQESNLTAMQPRHITLYMSFYKHRHLASEGLINLIGDTGCKLRPVSIKMLYTTLCPHESIHKCIIIRALSEINKPDRLLEHVGIPTEERQRIYANEEIL